MRAFTLAGTVLAFGLAGCGTSYVSQPTIPPLAPQPTSPVAAQPLPPPTDMPPVTPAPTDVAAAQPTAPDPTTATEVRKADMIGGWKLASGGETCQLFMTLTTWTGGYRGNTRGCASDELKSVGAWDLNGKEIVLKDASGSPIARLYASSNTRFSGQTEVSKRGVQVFR